MKKRIPVSIIVFLFSMLFTSCSKEEKNNQLIQNTGQEVRNPSSFSYTIPKDLLEQELLALMKIREEGTSNYQKASIRSLDEHYEITISE